MGQISPIVDTLQRYDSSKGIIPENKRQLAILLCRSTLSRVMLRLGKYSGNRVSQQSCTTAGWQFR